MTQTMQWDNLLSGRKKKPKLLRCWSIEELEWGVSLSYENNFSLKYIFEGYTRHLQKVKFFPPTHHTPPPVAAGPARTSRCSRWCCQWAPSSGPPRCCPAWWSAAPPGQPASRSTAPPPSPLHWEQVWEENFLSLFMPFFKNLVAQWYSNLTFTISDTCVDIEELFFADIAIWDNFSCVYVFLDKYISCDCYKYICRPTKSIKDCLWKLLSHNANVTQDIKVLLQ